MILGSNVKQANAEIIMFCKRFNRNDKLVEHIVMATKNRVAMGKIMDLFNKDIFVELNYIECYWLIKAIKDFYVNINPIASKIDKIQLPDYLHFYKAENIFTEIEIQNAEAYYIKKQKTNTIIIENVNQVDENLYSSFRIPFSTIAEMFNNGIINYNFAAQREATVVDAKLGEYLYQPTVYRSHIEDIKTNIEKNTFFTNHVVFNILDNGEQLFEYNEEIKTLKFTKTAMSQMNILDGFHRCSAITELMNQNPDLDGYIQANIFMLNIDQAQSYILQESKASPISTAHTKELKKTVGNEIFKTINSKGSEETNKIFGKIGANIDEIKKYHTKFANINDLSNMLESCFDKEILQQVRTKRKLVEDLSELFNYWVDINDSDFKSMYNNRNYKSNNFKTRSLMFVALVYIYSKYFNCNDTEKIFIDIENINKDLNNISVEESKIFLRSSMNKKHICSIIDKHVDWSKYLNLTTEVGEKNGKI